MAALTARRQELERQAGVNFADFEPRSEDLSLDSFSVEFNVIRIDSQPYDLWVIGSLTAGLSVISMGYNGSPPVFIGIAENGSLLYTFVDVYYPEGHFILTFSGGVARWYHNGRFINEKSGYAATQNIKMQAMYSNGIRRDCEFRALRMFDYALPTSEVATLYNNGKPEEYVLPGYRKVETQLDYAAVKWTKTLQAANPEIAVTEVDNTTASFVGKRTDAVNNTIVFNTQDVAFPSRGGMFRIVFTIADNGTDDNNYTYGLCLFRKKDGSDVEFTPNRKLTPGENVFYFDAGEQVIDNGIWSCITYDTSRKLDVSIDIRVYAQGCIAEYLPQNLSTTGDLSPVEIVGANSYTWTGEASEYYSIAVTSRPFTEGQTYKIKVTVSDFVSGAPFMLLGSSSLNPTITIPPENGTHEVYGTFRGGFAAGVIFYGGISNTDRRLTLSIDSITAVDNIASAWLDSARQLPAHDEYLPPLLQSIGGHDLAANGMPKVLMKPVLCKVIDVDLMATSGICADWFWNPEQHDASTVRLNSKLVCDCGSVNMDARPVINVLGFKFSTGRKYRATIKYSLVRGSVGVRAIGDWSTGLVLTVQNTFDTEIKQYEYTTPILPYNTLQETYNSAFIYMGNLDPNSQFTIDNMIIEEYD